MVYVQVHETLIILGVRHPIHHSTHPLVDKSVQLNHYKIHNISLVHPILKMSFRYLMQEGYLAIRSDVQNLLFPLSTDIMACQVSNGQFCHINSPLYKTDSSSSCSCALFLQNKDKINKFCILSVINQTQDKAFNINDNFWSISTLQENIKLYTPVYSLDI